MVHNSTPSGDLIRSNPTGRKEEIPEPTSTKFSKFIQHFRKINPQTSSKSDTTIGGICPIGSITDRDIMALKE